MRAEPILFCSHTVDWGGAETVLADLLAELDRHRFAPHLACPRDGPLPARARELGVPVHALRIGGASPWRKAASLPRAARELRTVAAAIGARLVYANSMIAGYAGVLAQRGGPRCIWHLHVVTRSRLAAFALRRAAAVIAPSHAGAEVLARPGRAVPPNLHVVPNGVAERFFAPASTGLRAELGVPAEALLAGVVGRLDPHKGHDVLLAALARLPASPPVHAVVVGGEAFADALARVGGYGERLRACTRELGVAARVHFLGHRDDVAALLGQLDVVVVPSIALESAPRAIAEAQAAGRAVVGSRIGGVPELIDDARTGLLVPPGDVPALARALARLAGEPALRAALGAAGRSHAERAYRLPAFARAIEQVLVRTLA